jgi:hypothetical protein
MYGSNDVWEVAFKVVDVGDGLIDIFLNLLDNLLQLFIVDGEVVLEHSDSFLTGFGKDGCDFVDKVNFGD